MTESSNSAAENSPAAVLAVRIVLETLLDSSVSVTAVPCGTAILEVRWPCPRKILIDLRRFSLMDLLSALAGDSTATAVADSTVCQQDLLSFLKHLGESALGVAQFVLEQGGEIGPATLSDLARLAAAAEALLLCCGSDENKRGLLETLRVALPVMRDPTGRSADLAMVRSRIQRAKVSTETFEEIQHGETNASVRGR